MADYAASVLAKAQMMVNDRFQAAEMRMKPSAGLDLLRKNTDFLVPQIQVLRDREDRPTKAYLKNRTSRAAGSTRTHNHTGNRADSTEVDIAFTTYSDRFSTSLKRGDNNLLTNAEILAHEIDNALMNLHESIETAVVAWLDTNKNQVSAPPSGALRRATFNATNDVYEIALTEIDEFWNIMQSVAMQEKYPGQLEVLADSLLTSKGRFQANQGTGNSTNLGFQFAGVNVNESIELADATNYNNGLAYAFPVGMAGVLDWIPKQNRAGKGNFDSVLGGYGTIVDPMTGLTLAVHGYTERADTSGSNGNAQDEVTEWEISVDLSFQKAPITTANQTPILAFGIPTS